MEIASIINWIVTIALAGAIYFLYHRRALSISSTQQIMSEKLGRWSVVSELEKDIITLRATEFGYEIIAAGQETTEEYSQLELRHVLDNEPDWKFVADESSPSKGGFKSGISTTIKGKRYWQIREIRTKEGCLKVQYVSSQAFHDSLIWFRKVDRAIQAGILLPNEVVDWWRQILPMGWSGRLEYYRNYFQGHQDIESMGRVIIVVIKALQNKEHENAIDYCRYFNGADRDVLRGLGKDGVDAIKIIPNHRS